MIEQTVSDWHKAIRGELPGGLDELLDDDVVFYSPIVFSPQEGKEITKLYLGAAGATIGGQGDGAGIGGDVGSFRYKTQVMSGNHAVLEFESEVDGIYVNGVDMITCNDEGRIVEFKVMLRPLKAIDLMHAKMMAMLEQMQGGQS